MNILYWLSNLGMGAGGSPVPVGAATLREALSARLAGLDELTDIIGSQLHYYSLPQKKSGTPTFPAVSFYIVGRTYDRNLRGPNGVSTAQVRIDCWSLDELQAAQMATIVREHFDGFQGLWGQVGVMGCFLEDEADLVDFPRNANDVYRYHVSLTFTVAHRVSIPVYS